MTTKERFLKDVADHVMEVFVDNGVHRHIRFRKPGKMCMHFDLITWPGYLCYTGDMGTYVFRRLEDMFTFFRHDKREEQSDIFRWIDHRYWAEKLEASDKCDGYREFAASRFKRHITRQRREMLVEYFKDVDKGQREDFWHSLDPVINEADDGEHGVYSAVRDWEFSIHAPHMARKRIYLSTDDFPDCKQYTHRFLWCCYALRWGINKYDESKAK